MFFYAADLSLKENFGFDLPQSEEPWYVPTAVFKQTRLCIVSDGAKIGERSL